MKLLKSQKNEIFDFILNMGLSPREFEIKEVLGTYSGDVTDRVQHLESGYFFEFDRSSGNEYVAFFSPGNNKEDEFINNGNNWVSHTETFIEWLSFLKKELEQPDKWEQLFKEEAFFKSNFDEKDDGQFNYDDIQKIEGAIEQLKGGVEKLEISSEEIEKINKKLDYIVDRSKKLGKVDWKNVAISTFMGIASNLVMQHPKEVADAFVQLVRVSFKTILLLQ